MKLEKKLKHALKSNNISSIHEVFEEIYEKYNKLVFFIIIRYVNNIDDVRDLVQDTFVSFYNNLNNNIENIKFYLTTSAKNKAINFIKKHNNIIFDDEFIYKVEDIKNININYHNIIEIMRKTLTDLEIEIILQHTLHGYTFREIAKQLNMNLNTTISMYRRAIKKFKKEVCG